MCFLISICKKAHFLGNKTVDQRFGANLKTRVFCKNLLQISCFFLLFCIKNAENDYFDQHLEHPVEIYNRSSCVAWGSQATQLVNIKTEA